MARPKKSDAPDLTQRVNLTAGVIERLTCPAGKQQAFLRDSEVPGLRVRVTAAGAKAFVYESKLNRQTIRRTIGDTRTWTIEAARAEARKLAVTLDTGHDPRELERQAAAEAAYRITQASEAQRRDALTVGEAWAVYLSERREMWGELHYRDHLHKSKAGGEPSKRRGMTNKVTEPGPLFPLMAMRLRDLDSEAIEAWAAKEGRTRPTSARLAWRLLTVFLNWCADHKEFSAIVPARNPAKSKKIRESLGKAGAKTDVLTREQLQSWFAQVLQIRNPVIAAALQVMLLTGARPNEVLDMQWEDLNFRWKGIGIRDKIEGAREIPLTPYVEATLTTLPRRNQWVFSSARSLSMDAHNIKRRATKAAKRGAEAPDGQIQETSASGRISEPNTAHTRACRAAGIDGLTLHGLRRSFKSLTEWLEVPTGVVAQIQGHKPSATAEKHYTVRPLDLLRVHHQRIEAWILEQAGVKFDAKAAPSKMHAVITQR